MTPELDDVGVRRASFLVKRQQLVCAPVEAAHPGVRLRPHNEVERVEPGRDRSRMHARIAAPIDEGADDAALGEMMSGSLDPGLVEGQELVAGHLSARHRELAMVLSGDMSADRNIVGTSVRTRRASVSAMNLANMSGSRASPQAIRCRPSEKMSPGLAIGSSVASGSSGPSSATSGSSSTVIWSISISENPETTTGMSSKMSSFNSIFSAPRSQFPFSPRRLTRRQIIEVALDKL